MGLLGSKLFTNSIQLLIWAILLLLCIAYILKYSEEAPISYSLPLEPNKKEYVPGELFSVKATICAKHPVEYRIFTWFEDVNTQELYRDLEANRYLEKGCMTYKAKDRALPLNLPPGTYKNAGVAIVEGRFNEFRVPFETTVFTIKAK